MIGYVDPASIDLDLAYEMTRGWHFEDPPETFSIRHDALPKVIDFDELHKVKAPEGYEISFPYGRDIMVETSCFDRAIVWNSTHTFLDIYFYGGVVEKGGRCLSRNPFTDRPWSGQSPFNGKVRISCNRRVTEDDLRYGDGDWTGFHVGDMIYRWSSCANAIECALRIIELRFRNHGEIEICDCEEE